jgi:WD40 repeat protein
MSISTGAISPDRSIVITGSFEGYLVEWDVTSGERLRVLLDPEAKEDVNPRVVWIVDGVEKDPGYQISRLSECMRGSSIMVVRFSPDGSFFGVGAANGAIVLWNTESRGEILCWYNHKDRIDTLAFSPDNHWVAAGSLEDAVDSLRVWHPGGGMQFESSEAFASDRHIGGVSSLSFSPDNRLLVSGGFSMSGYTGPLVYDLETGKIVGSFYYDMTRQLDYSPDGKLLATGDDFGTVTFWDVETEKSLHKEKVHGRPVGTVLFSPDGRRLATGSWDGTINVWDVAARRSLAQYNSHAIVLAIRFTDDDRSLIVVSTTETSDQPEIHHFP